MENNTSLIKRIMMSLGKISVAGLITINACAEDRRDPQFDIAVGMYYSDITMIRSYAFNENCRSLDEITKRNLYDYLDKIDGIVASRYNVQLDEVGIPTGWISENGWKPHYKPILR